MANPSFETGGASPGEAQDWLESQSASGQDFAMFDAADGGPAESMEDFEEYWMWPWTSGYGMYGYGGYSYAPGTHNGESQNLFGLSDLTYALFEGALLEFENFEYSWRNPSGGPGPPFNHQSAWLFTTTDVAWAAFGALIYESFEIGWSGAAYLVFGAGDTSQASFDVVPEAYEDFEEDWGASGPGAAFVSVAALFDAGANAFENFEGVWTSVLQFP